jgi:hypothetical protein
MFAMVNMKNQKNQNACPKSCPEQRKRKPKAKTL